MQRVLVWVVLSASLVACDSDPVAAGGKCKGTNECQKGLVCSAGACTEPDAVGDEETDDPHASKGPMKVYRESKKAGDIAQQGVDKRMKEIMDQGKSP